MILSRNFVKDYIDLDDNLTITQIAEDMTRVGSEYDEARKFIDCTNLIIGEVIECTNHPDSDHLHLCKVNIGSEDLNIVCGAPNVRKGLKVIVALDGAVLPGGTIKKGMIRGQESNGMICSIAELGLDNKFLTDEDKNGIAELKEDAPIGEDPIKYLGFDDEIIDFELTANRGDLLSIIGMAYELGAIYDKKVKEIDLSYNEIKDDIKDEFNVEINTDNCSLFLSKKVKDVVIKESPDFIKNRLMASGIRPINNVVDISNYVMIETGQPLHFYDADNLGDTLVVRMANKDEKLTTLDNIDRTLDENDIVIANKKEAVGLAGVMGGLTTEVEETTKNVIIESAIFDSVRVRKTSNKILRSEASNRFEKGLDPKRTYMAIKRACNLLEKYASGKVCSGIIEYNKTNSDNKEIKIEYKNINDVLGSNISKDEILDVFRRLGFESKDNEEYAIVSVPSRRLDISIKEDLIEEVSRIYGVDNIESTLPKIGEVNNKYDNTNRLIRHKMSSLGLNETLTYVLVNDKESHMFTNDSYEEIKLLDPLTEDRNTLRYSVLQSLFKVYDYNKSHSNKDIFLFEIGKGFYKKDDNFNEEEKLGCLMSGTYSLGIGNEKKIDFYTLKGVVEELLDYLGYKDRYSFKEKENLSKDFHPYQSSSIIVNGKEVGIMGKLHPNTAKDVYAFEINLSILKEIRVGSIKFKEINKYPTIEKDMAFIVDKNILSEEIIKEIKKSGGKLVTHIEIFDIYTGENIGQNNKSIAFKVIFEDYSKTLTDEEVMPIFNKIITSVEDKFNAKLRNM
ncbi:MAG: phenylalanine--tRNA ligase subunit beta [Bacilli bacterium]|nr:phenylalanine--tRNA ligase subunit beta [Bacilli bacterium]